MYLRTGKHTITKVENMGEFITLDDNSRWQVSMFDKSKSMMWMTSEDVTVSSYIGSKFKITHIKKMKPLRLLTWRNRDCHSQVGKENWGRWFKYNLILRREGVT